VSRGWRPREGDTRASFLIFERDAMIRPDLQKIWNVLVSTDQGKPFVEITKLTLQEAQERALKIGETLPSYQVEIRGHSNVIPDSNQFFSSVARPLAG